MVCVKPIDVGGVYRPCGQCMSCRINQKRIWTSRIMLETMFHLESVFVTMTYEDEHIQLTEKGLPNLVPGHFKNWMKKFRSSYSGHHGAIRFFGVGEYGTKTERPHYHAILFGAGLDAEEHLAKTWDKGFTSIAENNPTRSAYIAQYTTKKMTKIGDNRLGDRHPEFARMSNRRGIGFPACGWLSDTMASQKGMRALAEAGDVWNTVRIEGKIYPLGHYMRNGIREKLGLSNNQRERAIQLDRIDYETGEIMPDVMLEHFCPREDAADQNFPNQIKYRRNKHAEEIPAAIAIHAKSIRRSKTDHQGGPKI